MVKKRGNVEIIYNGATYVAIYELDGDLLYVTRNGKTKMAKLNRLPLQGMAEQLLREFVIPRGLPRADAEHGPKGGSTPP